MSTSTAPLQRTGLPRRDIVAVLILALLARLVFGVIVRDTYDYDEFVLLFLGREFAHGAVPYHDFMFFHPPLALVAMRAVYPLTSFWWPLGRVVWMAVDSGTCVLVAAVGCRLLNRRAGLIGGVVYALHPLALVTGTRVGQDTLVGFLGVLALYLLIRFEAHWAAGLAGVCVGLATMVKLPGILLLLPIVVLARNRSPWAVVGCVLTCLAILLPFLPESRQLYDQAITYQRTRWTMLTDQRLETIALYWLLVNPFALWALARRKAPFWLIVGFLTGLFYFFTSQVYFHYFVPILPFAALLSAYGLANLRLLHLRALAVVALAAALGWAEVVARGGDSPLYVTAAHLSSLQPSLRLIEADSRANQTIMADRFEYPYLTDRSAAANYFWNIGVIVTGKYLEKFLPGSAAVVLSHGASSGYPAGFIDFVSRRYKLHAAGNVSVWVLNRPPPAVK